MPEPFTGFMSVDGKAFASETEAICHEVKMAIEKSFPELKAILRDQTKFGRLAHMIKPFTDRCGETPSSAEPPDKETIRLDGDFFKPATEGYAYRYHAPPHVKQVWFGEHKGVEYEPGVWAPPESKWPEAVQTAMNTDNLGEVYKQDSKPARKYAAFQPNIGPEHDCTSNLETTDNPLISRCSICKTEYA